MRMLFEVSIPATREDRWERDVPMVINIEGEVWLQVDEYGVEILSARDSRGGAYVSRPSHMRFHEDWTAHRALIEAFEEATLVDQQAKQSLPYVLEEAP